MNPRRFPRAVAAILAASLLAAAAGCGKSQRPHAIPPPGDSGSLAGTPAAYEAKHTPISGDAPVSDGSEVLPLPPLPPLPPVPPGQASPSPSPSAGASPSSAAKPSPSPAPGESAAVRRASPPATPAASRKPSAAPPSSAKAQPQEAASARLNRQGQKRAGASLQELRARFPGSFIFRGSGGTRRIALTFDDAPDLTYTPRVLDILKEHGVKATFFVVGYRAAEHPEIVKRIVREGHVVGNHTYGHTILRRLPTDRFVREIVRSEEILTPLAGYSPRLIRPPYGSINEEELNWLKQNGYLTVNWNVDPEDWRGLPKATVLDKVMAQTGPGSIILMHSATGNGGSLQGTVEALPDIIRSLRAKGLEPVTLPELLQERKNK